MKLFATGPLLFEIKPKPSGGFVAHCPNPAMTIEAPTREALDAKLRAITEAFAGFERMKLQPREGLVRDENGNFSININLWSSDDTPDPKKLSSSDDTPDPKKTEQRLRAYLWAQEFARRFDYALDILARIALMVLPIPLLIRLLYKDRLMFRLRILVPAAILVFLWLWLSGELAHWTWPPW